MRFPRALALTLTALTLTALSFSACALGPNYARPPITPPPAWRGVLTPGEAADLADLAWIRQYQEPELAGLIQTAIAENLDLRQAVARIAEARARADAARADLGPTLSGGFSGQPRTRVNADETWLRTIYSLSVAFQWEIDFFGRLRRASEAARNDLLATEDGARAVMSSLVGDVTQAWFDLRVLDELIAITASCSRTRCSWCSGACRAASRPASTNSRPRASWRGRARSCRHCNRTLSESRTA